MHRPETKNRYTAVPMGPLTRVSIWFAVVCIAALFLVAAAGAAVRLLPWLLAPGVPFAVAVPFARALATRALEIAMLIGMPVGFGIAGARFVDRGEARALHAIGVSPARMILQIIPAAVALALSYVAIGGAPYESPGRFATALVQEGRDTCARVSDKRAVEVPLVGVTWLCFPTARPVVTGRVPGMSAGTWFTATTLSPNDDLTRIDLSELRVAMRAQHGIGPFNIHAHSATIAGLPAWGRPSTLRPYTRAALIAATAVLVALVAAFAVLHAALASRLASAVAAGTASLLALSIIGAVDKASNAHSPMLFLSAPLLSGIFALFLPWFLARLGRSRTLSKILAATALPPLPNGPHDDRNPATHPPVDPL